MDCGTWRGFAGHWESWWLCSHAYCPGPQIPLIYSKYSNFGPKSGPGSRPFDRPSYFKIIWQQQSQELLHAQCCHKVAPGWSGLNAHFFFVFLCGAWLVSEWYHHTAEQQPHCVALSRARLSHLSAHRVRPHHWPSPPPRPSRGSAARARRPLRAAPSPAAARARASPARPRRCPAGR